MAKATPKRIRATISVWGAGPGTGGTSSIEFRRSDMGWTGWVLGSALDAAEEIGVLDSDASWRDRVHFVIDVGQPAHEDHDPAAVSVTGARGIETDLLALAWFGPLGAEAARVLLELSDDDLARLHAVKAIRDIECANAIQDLNELVESESDVLSLIRSTLAAECFNWPAVSGHAERLLAEREREDESRFASREAALGPFAAEVHRMILAWEAANPPPTSSTSMMGHSARRSGLQRLLEDHAVQHGKLPSGRHRVRASVMGTALDFDVDLDRLASR